MKEQLAALAYLCAFQKASSETQLALLTKIYCEVKGYDPNLIREYQLGLIEAQKNRTLKLLRTFAEIIQGSASTQHPSSVHSESDSEQNELSGLTVEELLRRLSSLEGDNQDL